MLTNEYLKRVYEGLEKRKQADGAYVCALWRQRPSPGNAHKDDDHCPGKKEARSREEHLGRGVGARDSKQRIANLDARERRPPEKAAERGREQGSPRARKEAFLPLAHPELRAVFSCHAAPLA